jgi:hypothetical protein
MAVPRSVDARLDEAIALLRRLVVQMGRADDAPSPWQDSYLSAPPQGGRLSATDRLSMWFRPAPRGANPWDSFFDEPADPFSAADRTAAGPFDGVGFPQPGGAARFGATGAAEAPGPRLSLRLLLAEPEPEMLDADAESVVACLYDLVHAIGRQDVEAAMACIAPDYHALEDDREVDRDGFAWQLRQLLDSLRGYSFEASLVEIPQPILYPDSVLVYTEVLIDAERPNDRSRRTIVERRIAVFKQQRDKRWLIASLSPV